MAHLKEETRVLKEDTRPLEELLNEARALEAKDRAYFSAIPWTAKLMDDPDFTHIPMITRIPQPDTCEDSFIAETLNTGGTIANLLAYYRNLPDSPGHAVTEVRWLVHLGNKMSGWPGVAHGGMQSFLLDEVMAFMLGCSRRVPGATPLAINTVTVELKVRFLRAMQTPGLLVVEGRVTKHEGRKLWAEAVVKDERGLAISTAEGFFLGVKPGTGPKI